MKKIAIIVFVCICSNVLFSQSLKKGFDIYTKNENVHKVEMKLDGKRQYKNNKTKGSLSKVKIGSSYDLWTVINQKSNCLHANDELKTIMFTFENYPSNGAGYFQSSYSTNYGLVWNSDLKVYYEDTRTNLGMYPSGVIYNPTGNTNPNNAYAVVASPISGKVFSSFIGNAFSSMKFDGTNHNIQKILDSDTLNGFEYQVRTEMFLTSCDNGKVYIYGEDNKYTELGGGLVQYTDVKTVLNEGTYNNTSKSFDWKRKILDPVDLLKSNGETEMSINPAMAWSKDGSVGYMVYRGRRNDGPDTVSYLPITYKTTDGGDSWEKMKGFDYNSIKCIYDHIPGQYCDFTSEDRRANFGLIKDAVVDVNNNVHLLCYILGNYSRHADTLDTPCSYSNTDGILFDVHTTSSGSWDAHVVDSVYSMSLSRRLSEEDWPKDDVSIKMDYFPRAQMLKTSNGDKIFYLWSDTEQGFNSHVYNTTPDIIGRGYDVVTGEITETTNFTENTSMQYENLYLCAADFVFSENGVYKIPVTTTALTGTMSELVHHHYIHGLEFKDSDFSSVLFRAHLPSQVDVCEGDTVNLSVMSNHSSADITYKWSNGSTDSSITIIPVNDKETYTVTATKEEWIVVVSSTVYKREMPQVLIDKDTIICSGNTAVITPNSNVSDLKYEWSDGSTGTSLVVFPDTSVSYSYTVSNDYCSDVKNVEISLNSDISISSIEDTSIAILSSISLTTSVLGGDTPYVYLWEPVGELSASNVLSPVASPTKSTVYTLNVTDEIGCTASKDVLVMVDSAIYLEAGAGFNICSGSSVAMNVVVGPNQSKDYHYSWSPTSGLSDPSILNPTVSISAETTYTIAVTDSSNSSNIVVVYDSIVIGVDPIPTVSASSTSTMSICNGSQVNIKGTASSSTSVIASVLWSPDYNIVNKTVLTPVIHPIVDTVYTVIVTDAKGCSNSDIVNVEILSLPTITAKADVQTLCSGAKLGLSASGGVSYVWSENLLTGDSVDVYPTVSVSKQKNFVVTGTDIYGCNSTAIASAYVYALPTRPVITISDTNRNVLETELIGNMSYQWYKDSSSVYLKINGASTHQLIVSEYDSDDNYKVEISDNTIVANCVIRSFPYTVSWNGVRKAKYGDSSVSIYPNPSNGTYVVSLHGNKVNKINIRVIDLLGKEVYVKEINGTNIDDKVEISLFGLEKGVYFNVVEIDDSRVLTNKIIIQ